MEWKFLKSYMCPSCHAVLKDIGHYHACTKCIFSINKPKFEEIVNDKYKPRKEQTADERLEELNNYGRTPMSEDFSDSYPNQ